MVKKRFVTRHLLPIGVRKLRRNRKETPPPKRVDTYLQRLAWSSQIILVVAGVFGYLLTVRPVHQKQLLDEQIAEQLRNRYKAQGIGELELIQGELNSLQTALRRDLAYAELRNSYGQLFASVGLDPLPDNLPSNSVQDIAAALAGREAQWQAGQF